MMIRIFFSYLILLTFFCCITVTFGQSALITFEEVIDSSELIVIANVIAESTPSRFSIDSVTSPRNYGINTEYDGDIYFVKISRVLKGTYTDPVLKIILLFDKVLATDIVPIELELKSKYLLLLNKKIISSVLEQKYNLHSESFYTPTFEGLGVVGSRNSRQWKVVLQKTENYLGIYHKLKK